jgi:hypothetical protein
LTFDSCCRVGTAAPKPEFVTEKASREPEMSGSLNGLVMIGLGLAIIIGNRRGAESLERRFSKVDRGPLDPPLTAAEGDVQRRAFRGYRIGYVVIGGFFILIGGKNLFGL